MYILNLITYFFHSLLYFKWFFLFTFNISLCSSMDQIMSKWYAIEISIPILLLTIKLFIFVRYMTISKYCYYRIIEGSLVLNSIFFNINFTIFLNLCSRGVAQTAASLSDWFICSSFSSKNSSIYNHVTEVDHSL